MYKYEFKYKIRNLAKFLLNLNLIIFQSVLIWFYKSTEYHVLELILSNFEIDT